MSVTVTGTKRHLDLNSSTLTTTGNVTVGGDLLLDLNDNIRFGNQLAITKENNGELKLYGGTNSTDGGFEFFTWNGSAYESSFTLKNNQNVDFAGHVGIASSKYLEFHGQGKLINFDVSSWSNATEHNVLYAGWHSGTGDYLSFKVPGNSTTGHGNLIIGDNGLWFGRMNTTDSAQATDSNTNPHSGSGSNYFRVDTSGNATFSGAINLDSSHINIDGNGAVIFDNTNNNNAWYVRNGGSNSATLQFGLGTSPGSNIKHVFNGDGSVSLADDLTISGQLDGVTNMFLGEYLYHQGDGDTYLNFQNANEFRIVVGGSEKIHFNTSRARINQHLYVAADSTYDIGTSSARHANIYADSFHGDGSNLTNLPAGSAPSNMVTTDTTQNISGAKTFTNTGNTFNGHIYYSAYNAGGAHYPHFLDGSNNAGADVNWRQYYGSNYKTHQWTSDSSGNMAQIFQGRIEAVGELKGTSLDINGNADISGTLDTGKLTVSSASDAILTLNQTGTDTGWSYINFNTSGTRNWYVGQDNNKNFDIYNDNTNSLGLSIDYGNNSVSVGALIATTLNTGHGANELYAMNQNVRTTDDVTFDNLTVTGDLNITGDINSYNITDLDVVDKTITVGKGQNAANSGSSGIVVDRSDSTNPSMLWNQTDGRFEFNSGVTVSGQLHTTGSVYAKGALYVKDSDGNTELSHIQARSNGNEGFLTVSNGSNWGFIVRGPSNDPRIGAWYGGVLKIEGFHSSDGATGSNAIDFAQFDFGNDKFLVNAANSVYTGNVKIEKNTPVLTLGKVNDTTGNAKIQLYSKNNNVSNGFAIQYNKDTNIDRLEFIDGGGTAAFQFANGGNATFEGSVTSTTLIPSSHIYLGATKNLYLDGGGNTYIKESSADTVQIVTGGTVTAEFAGTALTLRNTAFTGNITASADSTYNIGTSSTRFAAIYADDFHGALAAGNISSGTLSTSRLDTNVARTDNTQTFTGNKSFEGNKFIKTNRRVTTSQKYPLGHYTPGETVFEIDPTWTNDELKEYFDDNNVSWATGAVAENAPGGYAIYIDGDVNVGGTYNSGFPYIPIDQDGIYYMEVWIKNHSTSSGHGHYMGSIDYESNFTSTDTGSGNPGSYGYWVMSNTNPGTSWVKKSGYIRGHHDSNSGFFETDATYWTPQALFNYTTPSSGTRSCYISGWKVIRVDHVGDRTFQDNVFVNKKLGIGTSDPGGVGYSYAEDLVILAGNSASDGAGISIDSAARQYGVIAFSDDNGHNGEIYYDHNGQTFNFKTSGTNRVTFHTSGITLQGTGRIQGIDTVSASTDAASKGYVDGLASNYATSSHNHDSRYLRKDAETEGTQLNLGGEISSGSSAKLQVYGFQRTGPIMIAQGNTSTTSWDTTNEKWLMNNSGNLYIGNGTDYSDRIFHDSYHPNADKWTTARTITLGGDLSGSVSIDGSANVTLSAQVTNNSHTHDDRYYTETESDAKYLLNTTDTLSGDLTVTGNSQITKTLSIGSSSTRFIFHSGDVNISGSGTDNAVEIDWKDSTHYISSLALAFKVRLVVTGTGTDTGASYIVYYNNSTSSWVVRYITLAGTSSNHAQLTMKTDGTGTYMAAYHTHTSNYNIRYFVETFDSGDQDMDGHTFGSDFQWQRNNDTLNYTDGDVSITNNITAGNLNISNWNDAYTHSQANHAPSNAEQNVQSDWNATSGDAFIQNKPTIPSGNAIIDWTADQGSTDIHANNLPTQSKYLRSDDDDIATGNIEFRGDVTLGGTSSDAKEVIIGQIASTSSENTSLMIDGNGVVKTRNLGDAAFVNAADIDHDGLTNFVANEHIDWTSENAGTIHSTNVSGFAADAHNHDNRYYTETEVDGFAVKLTGTQTIAGAKTFTDDVTIDGEDLIINNTSGSAVITLHHGGTMAGSVAVSGGLFAGTAVTTDYDLDIKGAARFQSIAAATSDTNKFLVSDSGVLKFRTGAEVLSDIGAGTSNLALGTTSTTALAGNTTTISSAQSQKLGYITVTQAVNLDTVESNAATAAGWGNHASAGYLTASSTQSKYIRSDASDNVTGHTEWQDGYEARFGNGADMSIYHSSGNNYIDSNIGHLYIRGNVDGDIGSNIYIRPHDNEEGIVIEDDAGVKLYYNNSQKMNTTNSGISVTGTISATSTIGNKGTNIGQQMEYGNSSVATLRCDADRWRIYMGGGGQAREALSIKETGNVGIHDSTPSYKLDVNGTIRATGDVIAYSDERVKENIKTIDNSLEKVNKLRGVEFNKIGEDKKSIGVIAQEIEKILPEVVRTDDEGMKSVAYGNVVGVLIEAVKELTKEVEDLKKCNKCKNCNCNG